MFPKMFPKTFPKSAPEKNSVVTECEKWGENTTKGSKSREFTALWGQMVEATGFEHATSWSRTMRATRLRYASMTDIIVLYLPVNVNYLAVLRKNLRPSSHYMR